MSATLVTAIVAVCATEKPSATAVCTSAWRFQGTPRCRSRSAKAMMPGARSAGTYQYSMFAASRCGNIAGMASP